MARKTQSHKIDEANEAAALEFFQNTLGALPDPHRAQGQRYPLETVVVVALMAMVCGCDDAEAMQTWAEANEAWLASMLKMPHGVPTQDVFLRVFAALDPDAFNAVFRSWVQLLTFRLTAQGKHLALDGKTSRRSYDSVSGKRAIHTVSAWMSQAGVVVGQRTTDAKSNEITVIPDLLKLIDVRGATVSIDAMGCQTHIAETIVEAGGDYLLGVKENQPTLHQDIVTTFAEAHDERARSVDEQPRPRVEFDQQTDKGHGRIETRTVSICHDLAWMSTAEQWRGLSFVAQVVRERTVVASGETSSETAYYIGSDTQQDAVGANGLIRQHWSVENNLHWVLDIAFREDEARHRAQNAAQNMSTLRHFALNIIKQDPNRKLGVANSRKRAGWDRNYLVRLLTGAQN